MKLVDLMRTLESLGSAQTVKTYLRHGATRPIFGVSYAALYKLQKQLAPNTKLATGLWRTGNHDARTLATLIVDPLELSSRDLDGWIDAVDNYPLEGAVAGVVARSKHAVKKADMWRKANGEWKSAAGWNVVAALAKPDSGVDDGWLEARLPEIANEIERAPNRTRYAMNTALIAIGGYRPALRTEALRVARHIGKVEVDHGDTACKTPDASSYIGKMADRQSKKKAAKKKATSKRATRKKAASKKTAKKKTAKKKTAKKKTAKKKTAKKKTAKKKTAGVS